MRIRRGFVSNSSTTSFCIYGTTVPEDKELSWSEVKALGLTTDYYNEYCDGDRQVIGLAFSEIEDDETGAEFKARVEGLIKQLLPEATEFGHHEDAYRDG